MRRPTDPAIAVHRSLLALIETLKELDAPRHSPQDRLLTRLMLAAEEYGNSLVVPAERPKQPDGKVAWTHKEYCAATSVSHTALYGLPDAMKPRSVKIGKKRVYTEPPGEWLKRIGG